MSEREPYNGRPPYVAGSDTSEAAADSIIGDRARMQTMVYECIGATGIHGATDDEVEAMTGLRHQTASARRRELVQKGRVVDTGMRRKTRSGRPATVWRVAS